MKHQQTQLASKRNFIRLMALAVMLVLMVCCTALWVSAADEGVVFDLSGTDFELNEQKGYWEMEYAGDNVNISNVVVKVNGTAAQSVTATLNNPNVIEGFNVLTVTYDGKVAEIPVKITPVELDWNDGIKGTTEVEYAILGEYIGSVTIPVGALDTAKVVPGETVAIVDGDYKVSFNFTGCGSTTAYVNVALDNGNYTVAPLPVDVTVAPAKIDTVTWGTPGATFAYGDAELLNVKAFGNGEVPMTVLVKVGEEWLTLAEAFGENGLAAGTYELGVAPVTSYYVLADDVTVEETVVITKAVYNVVLNDREFVDNGGLSNPNASIGYGLVAEGKDGAIIPEWVLSAITYTYTDANGNVSKKVTKPGVYTVKAIIPTLDNAEVKIEDATATMTVISIYEVVATPDGAIVIVGEGGIPTTVVASASVPKKIARAALRGLNAYKAYTLTITGAGDQVFSVRIPVSQDLIGENLLPLTTADLYIYNAAAGTKEAANTKYAVTLSEDGLYYIIEGYVSAGEITFLIAPEYDTPFWASAIGITLIVLLALILVIIVPMLIGMMLIRLERSGRNPIISVETKGNAPAVQPVVIPDKIGSADEIVENGLNDMADALFQEVPAEEKEYDVDATEATAEAMAQFHKELAEFDLAAYEAAQMANAEAIANELADKLISELRDQVPAAGADVSDEVKQTVAELMAENFNQSADATDAIALITEEEVAEEVAEEEPAPEVEEIVEEVVEEIVEEEIAPEVVEEAPVEETAEAEDSDDDDDDTDSFGGFGSMPLDYIDAIAEAERYAEMLEQEHRGEVQLVTRYRRSYLSRLAQSQGSIQDYYNVIKNLLLSYKGVKSRISWNFESFNVGRTPLAKFNAKTRTLYVYIALNPEELADTKYNFADMSEKKKYAAVPVLLKVKGDRKFKHALELITMLCEEKLQLPKKKNFTEEDYRIPFKTTEELVEEGIIKKLVAAIPLTAPVEEAVVEEAVVEEAVVEEAVAEEAVVEEAAVEEAVAEEAVVEEAVAEEAAVEEAVAEEAVAEEVPAVAEIVEEVVEEDPVEVELVGETFIPQAVVEEAPVAAEVVEEVVEEAPVEAETVQEAPAADETPEEDPVEIVLGEEEVAEEAAEETNKNA